MQSNIHMVYHWTLGGTCQPSVHLTDGQAEVRKPRRLVQGLLATACLMQDLEAGFSESRSRTLSTIGQPAASKLNEHLQSSHYMPDIGEHSRVWGKKEK